MASDFIRESILCYRHEWNLTFSEWRSVAEMKAKHWRVDAGEPYYWQFNTAGGDSYMGIYRGLGTRLEIKGGGVFK